MSRIGSVLAILLWPLSVVLLLCGFGIFTLGADRTWAMRLSATFFRTASVLLSPTSTPLMWSEAQQNLGAALYNIANKRGNIRLFREALSLTESALECRAKNPGNREDWAVGQKNLAALLNELGEYEQNPDLFKQSEKAYEALLHPWTGAPSDNGRAEARGLLAVSIAQTALITLEPQRFSTAYRHIERALSELDVKQHPDEWVTVQTTFVDVCWADGHLTGRPDRFAKAIEISDAILGVINPKENHLSWQTITIMRAQIKGFYGFAVNDQALMRSAIDDLIELRASKELSALRGLATTYINLGIMNGDAKTVSKGIVALKQAMALNVRSESAPDILVDQCNMRVAQMNIAIFEEDETSLVTSLEDIRTVLADWPGEFIPDKKAALRQNLSVGLVKLFEMRPDKALLAEAHTACATALANQAFALREGSRLDAESELALIEARQARLNNDDEGFLEAILRAKGIEQALGESGHLWFQTVTARKIGELSLPQ